MSVELVRGLVHGRWKAQALAATLRLGIPDALGDRALSPAELAERLGADEDGLRRLLHLLVALGVMAREADGTFRNTGVSRLLRRDHPGSVREWALRSLAPAPSPDGGRERLLSPSRRGA
jgi:hypothetical protein